MLIHHETYFFNPKNPQDWVMSQVNFHYQPRNTIRFWWFSKLDENGTLRSLNQTPSWLRQQLNLKYQMENPIQ